MRHESSIVALCSAAVAASSLVFYSILTTQTDAVLMASFITATAIASMCQIALVPNAMIFVYSAGTRRRRQANVFYAVTFELMGSAIGAATLFLLASLLDLPIAIFIAFLGFAMAGSTSCMGHIRADKRWIFYSITFVLAAFCRLGLILLDLIADDVPDQLNEVIVRYFLVPEVVRYLIVVPPIFLQNLRMPRLSSARRAFGALYRHWVYDIGSAIVEVGDRVALSAIVSPTLLVIYFFSRRLGAAVTIILEPIYSTTFKAIANSRSGANSSRSVLQVLHRGYLIGGAIALLIWSGTSLATYAIPVASDFIPSFVMGSPIIFGALILVDSMIAANRWSRYITLLRGGALMLLGGRLACLLVFLCVTWIWPAEAQPIGLVIGFASFALAENYLIRIRLDKEGTQSHGVGT